MVVEWRRSGGGVEEECALPHQVLEEECTYGTPSYRQPAVPTAARSPTCPPSSPSPPPSLPPLPPPPHACQVRGHLLERAGRHVLPLLAVDGRGGGALRLLHLQLQVLSGHSRPPRPSTGLLHGGLHAWHHREHWRHRELGRDHWCHTRDYRDHSHLYQQLASHHQHS